MGYNTRFELSLVGSNDNSIIKDLTDSNEDANLCLLDDGTSNESGKWYDHEKDLVMFSQQHPEVLFKLSGEGSEANDLWHKYFKNGKVQVCKAVITFKDFDEKELS